MIKDVDMLEEESEEEVAKPIAQKVKAVKKGKKAEKTKVIKKKI